MSLQNVGLSECVLPLHSRIWDLQAGGYLLHAEDGAALRQPLPETADDIIAGRVAGVRALPVEAPRHPAETANDVFVCVQPHRVIAFPILANPLRSHPLSGSIYAFAPQETRTAWSGDTLADVLRRHDRLVVRPKVWRGDNPTVYVDPSATISSPTRVDLSSDPSAEWSSIPRCSKIFDSLSKLLPQRSHLTISQSGKCLKINCTSIDASGVDCREFAEDIDYILNDHLRVDLCQGNVTNKTWSGSNELAREFVRDLCDFVASKFPFLVNPCRTAFRSFLGLTHRVLTASISITGNTGVLTLTIDFT